MVGRTGGVFDRRTEVVETLRQGPGAAAQSAVMPSPTGPAPTRWTLRTIRVSFDWLREYTLSGVWYLLRRYKLRLRSARVQLWSPDPDYASKTAHLVACLQHTAQHPKTHACVFLDEMGYYRWPAPAPTWALAAPAAAPVAERGGGNNQQWRLIGALNAVTGQVHYLDNYIVGRQQVIALYQQLETAYAQFEHVYVVQDNWSIHTHPDVLTALRNWPRLEPVWLPTYAPWLNPIEKLWRWLRQDMLKMHRWATDWAECRQRVNAFLDQFADGSEDLLRYVGLRGGGSLAQALTPT